MKKILLLTEAIYCNIFRCNYLKIEKLFLIFFFFLFLHFLNLDSILKIFKKRMTLQAHVFLNLRSQKNVVRKMYKKSRFRGPFDKYHGK